jgi:hypothetical protein
VYNSEFYRSIDDPRGYLDEYSDPRLWRQHLRQKIYQDRKGLSDISLFPLRYGYDLHESLFSRKYVPKSSWQELLFSGPNVMILSRTEHIPQPPTRTEAYWIAVINYGKEQVDKWILSLPWKVKPDMPWRDSNGAETIARIPEKYSVDRTWDTWYDEVHKRIDCDG